MVEFDDAYNDEIRSSLCQRLGLTRSVRNKPRARSANTERRRRESSPEAKDERSESFAGGARGFATLHHEGANTIFLTNRKLSLDKRLSQKKTEGKIQLYNATVL